MNHNVKSTARKILQLALLCSLCLGTAPGWSQSSPPVQLKLQQRLQIGEHRVDLELYGSNPQNNQFQARHIEQRLLQSLKKLEKLRQQLQSFEKPLTLSAEGFELMQKLKSHCQWSKGAFLPTQLGLLELWGFSPRSLSNQIPDAQALKAALKQAGDCEQLHLEPLLQQIWPTPGLAQLNWKAFSQGFLLEQLQPLWQDAQLSGARVQAEDVGVFYGTPPDAKAWKVPLVDPRAPQKVLDYLYLKNQALAVMGDHQDYFIHNGIRYHHHLDGRTGYPLSDNLETFVIAVKPTDAELSARTLMLLNDSESRAYLQLAPQVSAVKIAAQNGVVFPIRY